MLFVMNAKTIRSGGFGKVAPCVCAQYCDCATSHFIRYTNGFSAPAVLEIIDKENDI